MKNNLTSKNAMHRVYGRMIILAFLCHILFTLSFITFPVWPLVIYNTLSCIFYAVIYLVSRKGYFRTAVSLVHLEICQFVIVTCYYLGWNLGFSFYLIALASLVYFCPFQRKYIPYLFSLLEIITFLSVKIYTLNHAPLVICLDSTVTAYYLFNSIASFILIIYAAFISKVSAVLTEQNLVESNTQLQDMVNHDTLTHLWSRTHLLDNYYHLAEDEIPINIVMTDVDNFKRINDTYGHDCGDYVLARLADIIRSLCPPGVGICRWGGEEFVMMFADCDISDLMPLIEKIRHAISAYQFTYHGHDFHVTMTFGISIGQEANNIHELISLADERMYQGKRSGKNRIIGPASQPAV